MKDECACGAAFRLGVTEWRCKEHGYHAVTVIPVSTFLAADEDAYVLLQRIEVCRGVK